VKPHNTNQRGQATVELAVAIPFVVLLLMLLVQVGIVMFDQLAVAQAAREGARAAAVDPTPGAAASAAGHATRLDVKYLSVKAGPRPGPDGLVRVDVSYQARILLPFTDQVLLRPVVTSSAAMRVEGG
jgi:hypothetical protein